MVYEFIIFLCIGMCAGLLAGMFGIGGGGLIVPALIFTFRHFDASGEWITHIAIATSLATIMGTSLSSTWYHNKNKNVEWGILKKMVLGCIIGTIAGAEVATYISGVWLKWIFIVFLVYTSAKYIFKQTTTANDNQNSIAPSSLLCIAAGAGIGVFASLVGVGGGVLVVPFLKKCGLHIRRAIGTSAAFTLPVAFGGTVGYIISGWNITGLPDNCIGFIYWPAAIAIVVTSMPMAKVGVSLAQKLSVNKLIKLFGLFLLAIAIKLAIG